MRHWWRAFNGLGVQRGWRGGEAWIQAAVAVPGIAAPISLRLVSFS
jgi:hypothetical protein